MLSSLSPLFLQEEKSTMRLNIKTKLVFSSHDRNQEDFRYLISEVEESYFEHSLILKGPESSQH